MSVAIPNRPVFRAQEVCELADVQPYVLRTWEAEFPDLGVAKTANGPRIYRRADVERVLRIKHLILVDGLTLAGVRRQLGEEPAPEAGGVVSDAEVAALMDNTVQQQLREVRRGLQWILTVLSNTGVPAPNPPAAVTSGPDRSAARRSKTASASPPKREPTTAKSPARGRKR